MCYIASFCRNLQFIYFFIHLESHLLRELVFLFENFFQEYQVEQDLLKEDEQNCYEFLRSKLGEGTKWFLQVF